MTSQSLNTYSAPLLPQEILDEILEYILDDAYPDYINNLPEDDRYYLIDDPLFDYVWDHPFEPWDPAYHDGGRQYALTVLKMAELSIASLSTCMRLFKRKCEEIYATQYRWGDADRGRQDSVVVHFLAEWHWLKHCDRNMEATMKLVERRRADSLQMELEDERRQSEELRKQVRLLTGVPTRRPRAYSA